MKISHLIRESLRVSDLFATKMIEDMRDAALVQPTEHGGNHTLWVVGHLACSEAALLSLITDEPNGLEHWGVHFAPGTQPTDKADDYPPLDEVIAQYRAMRSRTFALLDTLSEVDLAQPPKQSFPGAEDIFATVGQVLNLIVMHQEFHMGQVAVNRRAAGRAPLVAAEVLAEMSHEH